MAAPSPTARETPLGISLDDGYQTLITFLADPDISLWEKSVTPPGVEGGDAVETTTMHNLVWRTMAPRALKTLTDSTFTAAYDPDAYDECRDLINVETTITITFPDGSTLAFFGFLKNFQANELSEGTHPEATCTIVATNQDSTGAEQAPVMTEVEGT